MVGTTQRQPVILSEAERQTFAAIEQVLAQGDDATVRVTSAGRQVELPEVGVRLLRTISHYLAQGQVITYVPLSTQLTTRQAAHLLNVSRPYLVRLLHLGEIPFTMVGTHHRIAAEDLFAYKQRRDRERDQHLVELTKLSEYLDLYDKEIRLEDLEK